MSADPQVQLLGLFRQQSEAMQEQSKLFLSTMKSHIEALHEQSAALKQVLSVQQQLLSVAQNSLAKLGYLELRADSAGGGGGPRTWPGMCLSG